MNDPKEREVLARQFWRQFFILCLPFAGLEAYLLFLLKDLPSRTLLFTAASLGLWAFSTLILAYAIYHRPWKSVQGYFWALLTNLLLFIMFLAVFFPH